MYNSSFSDSNRSNSIVWRKRARNRGVILPQQGWQKLTAVVYDRFGNRYTYEQLSERSQLDRTSQAIASPAQCLNSTVPIDVNLSSEELVELCQRLTQDLRRISDLLDEIAANKEYSPNNSVSGIFNADTDNPVRQFQSDRVLAALPQAC